MPYRKDFRNFFEIVDPETGGREHTGHTRCDLKKATSSYMAANGGKAPIFDTSDRERLLWMYCYQNFNLVACKRAGFLAGVFSLHQQRRFEALRSSTQWRNFLDPRLYFSIGSLNQGGRARRPVKVQMVLNYFGQRIAFYFAFIQFLFVVFGTDWGDVAESPLHHPTTTKFPGGGGSSYAVVAVNIFVVLFLAEQLISLSPDQQPGTRVLARRHQWQQQKLARLSVEDDDYTPPCLSVQDLRVLLGSRGGAVP